MTAEPVAKEDERQRGKSQDCTPDSPVSCARLLAQIRGGANPNQLCTIRTGNHRLEMVRGNLDLGSTARAPTFALNWRHEVLLFQTAFAVAFVVV